MTLKVQAQVVDIRNDTPKQQDRFLIDTNIWLYLYYNRASTPGSSYQDYTYTSYITKAKYARSSLFYCGLSLAEIAHVVEQREWDADLPELELKDYRHNYPAQRDKVVRKVKSIWNSVKRTGRSADILINKDTTQAALTKLQTQLLDGYDLFIVEAMNKAGVDQIITNDRDFVTVPNIVVFTANGGAIKAARSQGQLVVR
ncbi:MAG: type II toxin-antitoxin system VapC family toxin [Symploca sp. SIO2E6]|nr:type II toxin-antitoxin system VapC family toxin [Symploca sp. SIO2E6]